LSSCGPISWRPAQVGGTFGAFAGGCLGLPSHGAKAPVVNDWRAASMQMPSALRKQILTGALVVAVTVASVVLAPASRAAPGPAIRGAGSGAAIPGKYIVVLKDSPTLREAGVPVRAGALVSRHDGVLGHVYQHSLRGFSATLNEAEASRMAAEPDVAYVERDRMFTLADTQDNPPWGLDRIDQRARPLDQAYSYDLPAATVTAYVIDSGIRITHTDIVGRARYGWDFFDNDPVADDCFGHGTHVAGILGGRTYGVAKHAQLVSVKVFGCTNGTQGSTIIAAVDWVTASAVKPAVVNISISAECLPPTGCTPEEYNAVATAITNSINSGLTYVVSAGNANINACNGLISRIPLAITVGATDVNDVRASYSNWGPCVNLWAPGGDQPGGTPGILSLGIASDTAARLDSGTSMAAPHVAGTVALILGRPGWATKTPIQIRAELSVMATNGAVTDRPPGTGSTTQLLYTAPPPKAGGSSIAVARNQDGRLEVFGVNSAGALFRRSQTAAGANTWSAWTQSVAPGWYSVAAQTAGNGRVSMAGLRRSAQDVWRRTQVSPNLNNWSVWRQFDGLLSAVALARESGGPLVVFGVNGAGQVFHRHAASGADNWFSWSQFDPPPGAGVPRSVAADTNANGLVEVFVLTNTGQIWHRWQTALAATTFTPWVQLDGALASIAIARNPDGALQLFGVNGSGQVFARRAGAGTNNWFSWSQLDTPPAVGMLRSLAAETNADGRVELFAVNTTGQIWHRWQSSAGSDGYSAWIQLDGLLRP